MQKLMRHRIVAINVNHNIEEEKIKFVYINDEMTGLNRKLLWVAKTKAILKYIIICLCQNLLMFKEINKKRSKEAIVGRARL